MPDRLLVIGCGALAREVIALKQRHGWSHLDLVCLDAQLHNRPLEIPKRLRAAIRKHGGRYRTVFVAYADCGTGGGIDRVIAEEGAERLPGAHCYEVYAGPQRFDTLAAEEPGSFYLTDFLARHFVRLVVEPLGLDRHPALRDAYFGNYRRVVYIAQTSDPELLARAREAAAMLELEFIHEPAGYGLLQTCLLRQVQLNGKENAHSLA